LSEEDRHRPAFPPGLGVAVAVLSVSFAAPLFRLADAPAVTASFWRLALAVLLLLPFTGSSWARWRTWHAREWGLAAVAGIALAAHFALWVASLFMTTVAASTSLVTLQAVFVALGGHFLLGDRLPRRSWAGVAVATGGAVLLTAADGSLAPDSRRAVAGDLLALVAGMGSAIYFLVGRRLRARRGLVEYVTPVYAVAALALLAALPFLHQPVRAGLPPRTFLAFVLLAAVPMLGGHTVANWCLKWLPAHTVATWILLEPVGAALLAWPILGEVPSPWVAAGAGLVLAGAALTIPRAPSAQGVAAEPVG
jgi:drug/metabolite transporter (DMT)-like permease